MTEMLHASALLCGGNYGNAASLGESVYKRKLLNKPQRRSLKFGNNLPLNLHMSTSFCWLNSSNAL